jgi:DNA-binding transcriptional ArsR family regulator
MDCLSALAEPTRRRIIEMLAQRELSAGEIADRFDVSASCISQHLKVLRDAQLVRVRVEAQRRIYELDPDGFGELAEWLGNIRQFWRGRLGAQERRLIKRGQDGKATPGETSKA